MTTEQPVVVQHNGDGGHDDHAMEVNGHEAAVDKMETEEKLDQASGDSLPSDAKAAAHLVVPAAADALTPSASDEAPVKEDASDEAKPESPHPTDAEHLPAENPAESSEPTDDAADNSADEKPTADKTPASSPKRPRGRPKPSEAKPVEAAQRRTPSARSSAREHKEVQRLTLDAASPSTRSAPAPMQPGSGSQLRLCPVIEFELNRNAADELKPLARLLCGRALKRSLVKKTIREFSGFSFDRSNPEYEKRLKFLQSYTNKALHFFLEVLDLERGGKREDWIERIMKFCEKPEPSGRSAPVGGKRGRKRKSTKGSKSPSKSVKRRKVSDTKNESIDKGTADEESDEAADSDDDETDDDEKEKKVEASEGEESEAESETSAEEEEEEAPKRRGRKPAATKAAQSKTPAKPKAKSPPAKPKAKSPPAKAPKMPASPKPAKSKPKPTPTKTTPAKPAKHATPTKSAKATPAKSAAKTTPKKTNKSKKPLSDEETDSDESDDAPKSKKADTAVEPTDANLQKFIKHLVQTSDLTKVTMNDIIKQVERKFSKYDLSNRKASIKVIVKKMVNP